MTMAQEYNNLIAKHETALAEEFFNRNCIADTVDFEVKGAGWSCFTSIFLDGSVFGLSNCHDEDGYLILDYSTQYDK